MKIKVYYHIWDVNDGWGPETEDTIIFHSHEFGWMEYDEKPYDPLIFSSKEDLIKSTYTDKSWFKTNGKIIYLGEL